MDKNLLNEVRHLSMDYLIELKNNPKISVATYEEAKFSTLAFIGYIELINYKQTKGQ